MKLLCRKCNVYYEDPELKFCSKCGTTLEEVNICPKCHTENDLDFVFCAKCGTRLNGNDVNKVVPKPSQTIQKDVSFQPVPALQPGTANETVSASTVSSVQEKVEGKTESTNSSSLNRILVYGSVIAFVVVVLFSFVLNGNPFSSPESTKNTKYKQATSALNNKNYSEAALLFNELGDYKDSSTLYIEAKYQEAMDLYNKENYMPAAIIFSSLQGYKDSQKRGDDARIAYVERHLDVKDTNTLQFLRDLASSYPLKWNPIYQKYLREVYNKSNNGQFY